MLTPLYLEQRFNKWLILTCSTFKTSDLNQVTRMKQCAQNVMIVGKHDGLLGGKKHEYNKKLFNYNPTININLVSLSRLIFWPPPFLFQPSVHPHEIFCQLQSVASVRVEPLRIQPAGRQGRERGEGKVFLFFKKCNKPRLIILFWSFKCWNCPSPSAIMESAFTLRCTFIYGWTETQHFTSRLVFTFTALKKWWFKKKKEPRHHWAQDRISTEI